MHRSEITFQSGDDHCAAWLYRPDDAAERATPVVVMAHGLSGTRRDRLGPFAQRFAQAGYTAMVFDHRGFGDSGGEPDLFEPARQLEDWRAAIACARSLPGVDADRIVTFGSSMGGGNALAAAADDRRVAAAISQVPFLDMLRQAHRSSPRVAVRTLLTAIRGGHLPAVGQPDEPAFINAPESEAGWRRVVATGEDSRWRDRVSARWLLGRPFNPGRHAGTLHCPWLVCVGEADRVARPGPAIAAAVARRTASCGPTRASTTSTSTTVRHTRPWSPTSSPSWSAIAPADRLAPMSRSNTLTTLAALRLAIGTASWATPRLAGRTFGLDAGANPQSPYLARLFGVRDFALGYGLLTTTGETRRQWLAIGAACDVADAVAGVAGARGGYLPKVTSFLVTGAAVAAAGLGVAALRDAE